VEVTTREKCDPRSQDGKAKARGEEGVGDHVDDSQRRKGRSPPFYIKKGKKSKRYRHAFDLGLRERRRSYGGEISRTLLPRGWRGGLPRQREGSALPQQ
jgi:hypothetical protein